MTADRCTALHLRDVAWLEEQLQLTSPDYDSTVVMTHHLPSYSLVSSQYANSPLNVFYASNLDHLVIKANVWLCGHSHTPQSISIGSCRCYLNPVGYTHQQTGYDLNLMIAVAQMDTNTVQASI